MLTSTTLVSYALTSLSCALIPCVAWADEPPSVAARQEHPAPATYPRLRVAAEVGGGFFRLTRGSATGGSLLLRGRVGVQFNAIFGLVYQGGGGLLVMHDPGGDTSDSWKGGVFESSILAIATVANVVDLGLGPSLDVYVWGGSWVDGPFSAPSLAPGGHTRIAVHIPGWKHQRPAFSLGWDTRLEAFPLGYAKPSRALAIQGELSAGAEWY